MKNTVRLNEAQLRKIVADSVKKCLEESILGGTLRRFYHSGKYDNEKLSGVGDYIKGDGNTDNDSYNFWKGEYKKDKENLKKNPVSNPNGKNGRGGYSNWTNKAVAQDFVDNNASNAMMAKPGLGGKLARAASVPAIAAAHLAGRMGRKRNPEPTDESIKRAVRSVLKEFQLSDETPLTRDNVTPGDSLPYTSTEPRKYNSFGSKTARMNFTIKNNIRNKENMGGSYSLKELSDDIARRFKLDPSLVFKTAKKIYNEYGGINAMDA